MNGRVFIDTNVLLYVHDGDAGAKRAIAFARYQELIQSGRLIVSSQVLSEFFVNATRPRQKGRKVILERSRAERAVALLAELDCYPVTPADCLRAIQVSRRNTLGYWDALIVVAAANAGA